MNGMNMLEMVSKLSAQRDRFLRERNHLEEVLMKNIEELKEQVANLTKALIENQCAGCDTKMGPYCEMCRELQRAEERGDSIP